MIGARVSEPEKGFRASEPECSAYSALTFHKIVDLQIHAALECYLRQLVGDESAFDVAMGVIHHTLSPERASSYSPGLRGMSYPGFLIRPESNSEGVVSYLISTRCVAELCLLTEWVSVLKRRNSFRVL